MLFSVGYEGQIYPHIEYYMSLYGISLPIGVTQYWVPTLDCVGIYCPLIPD